MSLKLGAIIVLGLMLQFNSLGSIVTQQDVFAMSWTTNSDTNLPYGRDSFAMVFDSKDGNFYMFGGWTDNTSSSYTNETWSYNPNTGVWTNLTTSNNPGDRGYIDGYYSPADNVFVIFGGTNDTYTYNDTWYYHPDTNQWENVTLNVMGSGEPNLSAYGAAYDNVHDIWLLLGGGPDYFTNFPNLWSFNTSTGWANLTSYLGPSGRTAPRMVYDALHDQFVIHGGFDDISGDYFFNETYTFDLNTKVFTLFNNTGLVTEGDSTFHYMNYDPVTQHIFMTAGNSSYVLDPSDYSWSNVTVTSPAELNFHRIVYNPAAKDFFMFSGYSNTNDLDYMQSWTLNVTGTPFYVPPSTTTTPSNTGGSSSSITSTSTSDTAGTSAQPSTSATSSPPSESSSTGANPLPILTLTSTISILMVLMFGVKYVRKPKY